MENKKENNTQQIDKLDYRQIDKLDYRQRELNNDEISKEEYKFFWEERNESDKLYLISSILNSNS